jgi:ParB-like chromosome segregation protein Spo0J
MNKHIQVTKKVIDLIPYVNNSRTHSDEQINQVASSIKEFGFTNPILIDDDNGVIAGHGRLMASKKLNLDEVPCIILKGLTEAQKKAYVIADNKIGLNSDWNYEKLSLELEGLGELDFDIDLLGFSEIELETILPDDIDLSILDELDDEEVEDLESNVKKAIQIEFEAEHYEQAKELISYWRGKDAYVGYMLISHLETEKNKL